MSRPKHLHPFSPSSAGSRVGQDRRSGWFFSLASVAAFRRRLGRKSENGFGDRFENSLEDGFEDKFENGFGTKLGAKLGDKLRDSFEGKSKDSFGDESGEKFGAKLGDKFGKKSENKFGDKPGENLGENLGDKFGNSFGNGFGEKSRGNSAHTFEKKFGGNFGGNFGGKVRDRFSDKFRDSFGDNLSLNFEDMPGDKLGFRLRANSGEKPGDKFEDNFGDNSGEKSGDNFGAELGDNFGEKSGDSFGAELGDDFEEKPRDNFGAEPGDNFEEKPRGNFGAELGDNFEEKSGGSLGAERGDDFEEKPRGNFGAEPGDDFEEKPRGNLGAEPGDNFAEKSGDNFGAEHGDDFEEKPGDSFGAEPGDDFEEKPGGNFGAEPGDDFEEKPGGNFGAELGDKFREKPRHKFAARFRSTSSGLALLVLLVASTACSAGSDSVRRYSRADARIALASAEDASAEDTTAEDTNTAGLVLGEFRLAERNPIPDGDTIRVEGLDASLRLLAIDTEETFKTEAEWAAYRAGWEQYKRQMRGDSPRPVKMATPMGEEATRWAEDFFRDSPIVRLERDHPGEIRGYFGRFLVYVFAKKDGEWVNYNIECVRAGMSPYFQKYGGSRRFHKEFVQAQEEARAAQRGIWAPDAEGYDDYDERLRWWDARGEALWQFEKEAGDKPNWIVLTRFDAFRRLEKFVGEEVVVFGGVGDITEIPNGPTLVSLSRDRYTSLPLVFFDKEIFKKSRIARQSGEFVSVRGRVDRYTPKRGRPQLQIIINDPEQISALSYEIEKRAEQQEAENLPSEPLLLDVPEIAPAENGTPVPGPSESQALPDLERGLGGAIPVESPEFEEAVPLNLPEFEESRSPVDKEAEPESASRGPFLWNPRTLAKSRSPRSFEFLTSPAYRHPARAVLLPPTRVTLASNWEAGLCPGGFNSLEHGRYRVFSQFEGRSHSKLG